MKRILALLVAVLLSTVAAAAQTQAPVTASVQVGKQATLSVTVTGTAPFTYQWMKAPTGGLIAATAQPIAGATNPTLVLANLTPADAGTYTVVVTNSAGSTTSGPGILTITSVPPTVTSLTFTVQ